MTPQVHTWWAESLCSLEKHTPLGFPGGSIVKNPRAMQETWVLSLGQEDPLEKEMATHSSILAWRLPWTEEPGGLQFIGLQKSDTTEWLTHTGLCCPVSKHIICQIQQGLRQLAMASMWQCFGGEISWSAELACGQLEWKARMDSRKMLKWWSAMGKRKGGKWDC